VDMHEAKPSSPLAWTIVANPKNLEVAANAIFDLEEIGVRMKLDQSSEELRGLSHREWGDHSEARAFLIETPNPAQEVMDGASVDQLNHPQYPLWKRVAIQLEVLAALVKNYDDAAPFNSVHYEGIPNYKTLEEMGLEAFL